MLDPHHSCVSVKAMTNTWYGSMTCVDDIVMVTEACLTRRLEELSSHDAV